MSDLAARQLMAMIEPFISHRADGRVRNDLAPEAMIRALTIASGLGTTSAYTWLKVPVVKDMEQVMAASTLPALLLGGEVADDPEVDVRRLAEGAAAAERDGAGGRAVAAVPGRRRRGRRGGHRGQPAVRRCQPVSTCRHLRAGTTAGGPWLASITPEQAGWAYSGLRVLGLRAGRVARVRHRPADEMVVLPLAGSCVVECDGERFEPGGPGQRVRRPDRLRLPAARRAGRHVQPGGGRFALACARARQRLAPRYGPAEEVPVEAARRRELLPPGDTTSACPPRSPADRLIACEVITPAGNWSSYPPHKHDQDRPGESVLEEIYYFQIAAGPAGPGVGFQRVYGTADRPADLLAEVRDGDAVLIPHGWHGPSMAAPGYDMYYLNVMAGPGAERAWLACDDPGARLGARYLARPAGRSAAAAASGRGAMTGGSRVRLTVGQAVVRFLAAQRSERDGAEHPFFAGCFGIFGHGNLAGIGQALLEAELRHPGALRYYQARNEQAMVHAAAAYARMRNRLAAWACTSSIGPGATNMVTGAALATINRLPVLLLPGDVFATRVAPPVLQELEHPGGRRRVGQRHLPAGVPRTSTGSGAPSSSRQLCWRLCAC